MRGTRALGNGWERVQTFSDGLARKADLPRAGAGPAAQGRRASTRLLWPAWRGVRGGGSLDPVALVCGACGLLSLSPSAGPLSSPWGAAVTAGTLGVPWFRGAGGLLCRGDPAEACAPPNCTPAMKVRLGLTGEIKGREVGSPAASGDTAGPARPRPGGLPEARDEPAALSPGSVPCVTAAVRAQPLCSQRSERARLKPAGEDANCALPRTRGLATREGFPESTLARGPTG